ncbi:MAG: YfcC family protein [Bacillota bacterium]
MGGALFGLAEQGLALVPVSLLLARSLGLDRIVAVAIIVVGSQAGFSCGVFNPFTVAVGHKLAELPLYSGKEFRVLGLIIFTAITIWYIARYIKKIKKNPKLSIVADLEDDELIDNIKIKEQDVKLTGKHKAALSVAVLAIVILAYGVSFQGWYLMELMYLFFGMAVVAGIVGGSGINKTAEDFVKGAETLTMGALIVGFARGIVIVLGDGMILDTIINGLASLIIVLPEQITVLGMYVVQLIINFFIPSGSGQAAATLPIMLPLGDMANITRQTTIVVLEYGNGLTNVIFPTVGICVGAIGIAKIPFEKW